MVDQSDSFLIVLVWALVALLVFMHACGPSSTLCFDQMHVVHKDHTDFLHVTYRYRFVILVIKSFWIYEGI